MNKIPDYETIYKFVEGEAQEITKVGVQTTAFTDHNNLRATDQLSQKQILKPSPDGIMDVLTPLKDDVDMITGRSMTSDFDVEVLSDAISKSVSEENLEVGATSLENCNSPGRGKKIRKAKSLRTPLKLSNSSSPMDKLLSFVKVGDGAALSGGLVDEGVYKTPVSSERIDAVEETHMVTYPRVDANEFSSPSDSVHSDSVDLAGVSEGVNADPMVGSKESAQSSTSFTTPAPATRSPAKDHMSNSSRTSISTTPRTKAFRFAEKQELRRLNEDMVQQIHSLNALFHATVDKNSELCSRMLSSMIPRLTDSSHKMANRAVEMISQSDVLIDEECDDATSTSTPIAMQPIVTDVETMSKSLNELLRRSEAEGLTSSNMSMNDEYEQLKGEYGKLQDSHNKLVDECKKKEDQICVMTEELQQRSKLEHDTYTSHQQLMNEKLNQIVSLESKVDILLKENENNVVVNDELVKKQGYLDDQEVLLSSYYQELCQERVEWMENKGVDMSSFWSFPGKVPYRTDTDELRGRLPLDCTIESLVEQYADVIDHVSLVDSIIERQEHETELKLLANSHGLELAALNEQCAALRISCDEKELQIVELKKSALILNEVDDSDPDAVLYDILLLEMADLRKKKLLLNRVAVSLELDNGFLRRELASADVDPAAFSTSVFPAPESDPVTVCSNCEEMDSELVSLKVEVEGLTSSNMSMNDEYEQLKGEYGKLQDSHNKLVDECKRIASVLARAKEDFRSSEEDMAMAHGQQIDEFQAKYDNLKLLYFEQENKVVCFEEYSESVRKGEKNRESDRLLLEAQEYGPMLDHYEQLRLHETEWKRVKAELDIVVEKLEEEKEDLKIDLEDCNGQLQRLQEEKSSLSDQLVHNSRLLREKDVDLLNLELEFQNSQSTSEATKERETSHILSLKDMSEQVEMLDARCRQLEEDKHGIELRNQTENEKQEVLWIEEKRKLDKLLAGADEQNVLLRNELLEVKQSESAAIGRLSDIYNRCELLEAENGRRQQECMDLTTKCELHQSIIKSLENAKASFLLDHVESSELDRKKYLDKYDRLQSSFDSLQLEKTRWTAVQDHLNATLLSKQKEIVSLKVEVEGLTSSNMSMNDEYEQLKGEYGKLKDSRNNVIELKGNVEKNYEEFSTHLHSVRQREKLDQLQEHYFTLELANRVQEEKIQELERAAETAASLVVELRATSKEHIEEYEALSLIYDQLKQQKLEWVGEKEVLSREHDGLEDEFRKVRASALTTKSEYEKVRSEHALLCDQYSELLVQSEEKHHHFALMEDNLLLITRELQSLKEVGEQSSSITSDVKLVLRDSSANTDKQVDIEQKLEGCNDAVLSLEKETTQLRQEILFEKEKSKKLKMAVKQYKSVLRNIDVELKETSVLLDQRTEEYQQLEAEHHRFASENKTLLERMEWSKADLQHKLDVHLDEYHQVLKRLERNREADMKYSRDLQQQLQLRIDQLTKQLELAERSVREANIAVSDAMQEKAIITDRLRSWGSQFMKPHLDVGASSSVAASVANSGFAQMPDLEWVSSINQDSSPSNPTASVASYSRSICIPTPPIAYSSSGGAAERSGSQDDPDPSSCQTNTVNWHAVSNVADTFDWSSDGHADGQNKDKKSHSHDPTGHPPNPNPSVSDKVDKVTSTDATGQRRPSYDKLEGYCRQQQLCILTLRLLLNEVRRDT